MSDPPVILITGTRTGIGRQLAEHYCRREYRVIGCSRGAADWEAPGYRHFTADVADEEAARKLFAAVRRELGGLDVLINNAGAAAMNHSLLTPIETVEQILTTNVAGTFLFSREAARLMQGRPRGRIVNFTSVAVPLALAGEAAYVASKAAVESLTLVMAKELADMKITVNAVGPTVIDTQLTRGVPQDKLDDLLNRQAIRRPATAADIINVIDFFLHPESDLVTGQVVYLGGV